MSRRAKHSERLNKAAQLFDVATEENTIGDPPDNLDNVEEAIKKLEGLIQKELRTWWDRSTLSSYVEKKLIPRGLRIKKIATTVYSEAFQNEWNDILTNCSVELMKLIIQYEEKMLEDLDVEIQNLQESIKGLITST